MKPVEQCRHTKHAQKIGALLSSSLSGDFIIHEGGLHLYYRSMCDHLSGRKFFKWFQNLQAKPSLLLRWVEHRNKKLSSTLKSQVWHWPSPCLVPSGDENVCPHALRSTSLFWAAIRELAKQDEPCLKTLERGANTQQAASAVTVGQNCPERPCAWLTTVRYERPPMVLPLHTRWVDGVMPTWISEADFFFLISLSNFYHMANAPGILSRGLQIKILDIFVLFCLHSRGI